MNDQRERKSEASQPTEEEALKLIELIEPTVRRISLYVNWDSSSEIDPQKILQHPDIAPDLKSTAFTVLRRLCGTFGKLPRSCLISEDFKLQEEMPFATRGYTDLWKRDWNGRKVAVKALRFGPDDDRSKTTKVAISSVSQPPGISRGTHDRSQRFCKEVLFWKRLSHPNVLPFYGASMTQNQFCMVSPWIEGGNILSYTRKNPEANRLRLVILIGQWTNVGSNNSYIAVDRCSKRSEVSSLGEPGARQHSGGMS